MSPFSCFLEELWQFGKEISLKINYLGIEYGGQLGQTGYNDVLQLQK